jgi:FAD/FMN-containing dehydrogenase
VGSVRDYVLGLQLINGKGEHLTFGGQVMKNVAGYDVSRLMAGAMGTLGVITEVSLKVLPVAPAEATLVFGLDQATALEQLHRWGGEPLPLNASCWVHDPTAGPCAATNACRFLPMRLHPSWRYGACRWRPPHRCWTCPGRSWWSGMAACVGSGRPSRRGHSCRPQPVPWAVMLLFL